jgi:hypothetical protein
MKRIEVPNGTRFGGLVTFREERQIVGAPRAFFCTCDCGSPCRVLLCSLRDGKVTSCGCGLHRKRLKWKHCARGTPEYRLWRNIIYRCYNDRCVAYKNYGGRGITMHPAWRADFAVFLKHIGLRPGPEYSLDRKNNARGYVPGNVQWATKKTQVRNMRTNRILKFQGRSQCLTAWAEELGISSRTIRTRLKLGWSVERALSQAISPKEQSWRKQA